MTDEEKKAIEYFKSNLEMTKEMGKRWGFQEEIKNNEIILNLIEKQSKEIEELKEVKWYYEISRVPKDKIKAKINEYKKQIEELKNSQIFTRTEYEGAIKFGQSLLEKE